MASEERVASMAAGGSGAARAIETSAASSAGAAIGRTSGERITSPSSLPVLARGRLPRLALRQVLLHRGLDALERLQHRLGVLLVDLTRLTRLAPLARLLL